MGRLKVTPVDAADGHTSRLPTLRWLLLALTLLGLAAMHTIGHIGADHAMAMPEPSGVQRLHAAAVTLSAHARQMARVDAAASASRVPQAHDGRPAGGHAHDWSVCLAILAALTVTVLAGRLLHAATTADATRRAVNLLGVAPRAPPVPVPGVGLRLADVSVLRR